MGLNAEQQQAVAEFTQDFENACVGIGLASAGQVMSPQHYRQVLAAAL